LIHLDDKDLKQVRVILKKHLPEHEIWLFGSRVHGKNLKPFSDIDLAIIQPTTNRQMMQLADAFSESDLPYKVDIIDWNNIDENFKKIIKIQYEIIQP